MLIKNMIKIPLLTKPMLKNLYCVKSFLQEEILSSCKKK